LPNLLFCVLGKRGPADLASG